MQLAYRHSDVKHTPVIPTQEIVILLTLSDPAVLDYVLTVAYFSFVNRIVMALGVTLEEDSCAQPYTSH